jgi:hypothetical protein
MAVDVCGSWNHTQDMMMAIAMCCVSMRPPTRSPLLLRYARDVSVTSCDQKLTGHLRPSHHSKPVSKQDHGQRRTSCLVSHLCIGATSPPLSVSSCWSALTPARVAFTCRHDLVSRLLRSCSRFM